MAGLASRRAAAAPPFTLPGEPGAWWGFLSSLAAGLAAVAWRAPQRLTQALALGFAMACLFLASEWISSLHGKGYRGDVPRGPLRSPLGWALLAGGALGLLSFLAGGDAAAEGRLWTVALAASAAFTALMFLLRLEMVPVDLRLVALSGVLSTLPALLLGFLALGGAGWEAWSFWLPAAVFFCVGGIFKQVWLEGNSRGRRRLALVAAPMLPLVVAGLYAGRPGAALALAAYTAYLAARLNRRFSRGGRGLPPFKEIARVEREQQAWNAALVAAWILMEAP